MTPDDTLKLVAAITLENSRQIGILSKACASLVELATPLLPHQPSVKTEIAVQLSALEGAQRRVVHLMPALEKLSRELDLDLPPAD